MSNFYNHLFETPDFRYMKVKADIKVAIGDLLYANDECFVFPVSNWEGKHNDLMKCFAGVALQATDIGDDDPIKVGVSGIFEFECGAQDFNVGDRVQPEMKIDGPQNTSVSKAAGLGTGSVYRTTSSLPRVMVDIHSAIAGPIPRELYNLLQDMALKAGE